MPKKQIDQLPEYKANLPRSGHPLSHDFSFTCTTSHLLPVFHDLLNPGETVKVNFDYNLRTMPLEAAAFDDLVCTTEYFFVPMPLLFQPFGNIYYGINDNFSSLFNDQSQLGQDGNYPVLNFDALVSDLYDHRADDVNDALGTHSGFTIESVGQSSIRLFDHLGFNPTGIAEGLSGDLSVYTTFNPNTFPYPFLAYNCIYEYYYRLDNRERFDQSSFNVDDQYDAASFTLPYKYFLLHYRPLADDYFSSVKSSPLVDVINLADGANTQLQAAVNWLSATTNISPVKSALQQAGFPLDNSPYTTMQQSLGVGGQPSYAAGTENSSKTYGVNGSPTTGQINVYSYGGRLAVEGSGQDLQVRTPHIHGDSLLGSALSTANIRALFASEKLWAITGRAKKTYDDQTLAHFGFKVPHDVKHQISCFGKDNSIIHIGEVISTASTSDAPLGEIAGKGYGSQHSPVKSFTAPCHGVVMVIFSVVSQRNYEAGILKANVVTNRFDLYQPEYDHLGMQPLFGYEARYHIGGSGGDPTEVGEILGWQYRYEQWKRRYNRTTGAFRNSVGSLKGWVPTYEVPYASIGESIDSPSYVNFINLPTDVNQLMLALYPSVWSSAYEDPYAWAAIYDNDPFVVNSHINCVKVSTMSDYSLPRLDA